MTDTRNESTEPTRAPLVKAGPSKPVGETGVPRSGGYIYDESILNLRGQKGMQEYAAMAANSAEVGAFLHAVEVLVRQVGWRVEPFSDEKQDQDRAERVDEMLHDMVSPWSEFVAECITSELTFGHHPVEKLYKRRGGFTRKARLSSKHDDGLVGIQDLPVRRQETIVEWLFADEGDEVLGLVQQPPPRYQRLVIEIDRLAIFRTGCSRGNPEGRSVLRRAYFSWWFIKRLSESEAIGGERDLSGYPVAKIPAKNLSPSATPDQKAVATRVRKIVENIRNDEQAGTVWPMAYDDKGKPLYELELLSSPGSRAIDLDKAIQRHRANLMMCLLADWLLLGHEKSGSFALSSDKTAMFAAALGGLCDSFADTFNRSVLPDIWRYNGWPTDRLATLAHGDIESRNFNEFADGLVKLSNAGWDGFPDEALDEYIRDEFNLPQRMETEEDIGVSIPRVPEPDPEPEAPEPPEPEPKEDEVPEVKEGE